jgi:cysteine-rich repeat protein
LPTLLWQESAEQLTSNTWRWMRENVDSGGGAEDPPPPQPARTVRNPAQSVVKLEARGFPVRARRIGAFLGSLITSGLRGEQLTFCSISRTTRWGNPCMGRAVAPENCFGHRGRYMSEPIWAGRCLPRLLRAVIVALVLGGGMAPATAHMAPVPIELWGPFVPEVATCLRTMSRATHACFETVLAIEARCQDARIRGDTCDLDRVAGEIDAATAAMRGEATGACAEGRLTEIGYFGFFDANADLFNACVTQARAAVSATYAPARAGTPSPAAAACMTASAAYGRKVMRFILERETPIMERFATREFPEAEKNEIVRQLGLELNATRERWVAGLLEACPQFVTFYGRSAEDYLRTLKQRTDCVLSKNYVNSAVSCLAQVCGNGIPEGDEACDDGNSNDADGCRSDCTLR